LRERLRVLFREELAQTVASEDEFRDEVRHLLSVLGASTSRAGREVSGLAAGVAPG
jgi:hypothetical protein